MGIKNSNILVTDDIQPKITDFVISKVRSSQATTTMTATGVMCTHAYAPPEVLQGSGATEAADIYAFGICLYEAFGDGLPVREAPQYSVTLPGPLKGANLVDLVMKLLVARKDDRPTAVHVVAHKFFSEVSPAGRDIIVEYVKNIFAKALVGTYPYPEERIKFEVIDVQEVRNERLEQAFERCRLDLARKGRSAVEMAPCHCFHGCSPSVVHAICDKGLLKVGHPENPSTSTDLGYFGNPREGVYVSTASDYCLKYANGGYPLSVGDEVEIVVLKVLPGKTYQFRAMALGVAPEPGYDSHMSPHQLEYYCPLEGQTCPEFVVRARADAMPKANHCDDGIEDASIYWGH